MAKGVPVTAPGCAHGLDVDDQGYGTVDQQRLYKLLQPGAIVDGTVEITFLTPGVEGYAFTFG